MTVSEHASATERGRQPDYSKALILFSAMMMLDTLFATAAAPLVPKFADEYGLSKPEIGVFVAAHSGGALVGALIAAFASTRIGGRRLLLAGLLLSAATSFMFGFAETSWGLNAARFGHGIGSSLSWTAILVWMTVLAPRARLGWVIGVAWGANELGSVLGPLIGGTASRVGLMAPFVAIGVATLPLVIWVMSLANHTPARSNYSLVAILRATSSRRFAGALWLASLPAFMLGTVGVLVPVQLDDLGWERFDIGLIYAVIGVAQIAISLVAGRLADRMSLVVPLRIGLVGGALAATCLALPFSDEHWRLPLFLLAIFCAVAFLLAPGTVLVSKESEAAGIQQGVAFSLANISWAPGAIAGALLGGAIATLAGDSAAFLTLMAVCLVTLVGLEHTRRHTRLARLVPE